MYKMRVPKGELRTWEFWDIEQTLELWQEQMQKEKEENDKQQKAQEKQYKQSQPKYSKPSMPSSNYGGFKVPK
jgi:hypothetical protein